MWCHKRDIKPKCMNTNCLRKKRNREKAQCWGKEEQAESFIPAQCTKTLIACVFCVAARWLITLKAANDSCSSGLGFRWQPRKAAGRSNSRLHTPSSHTEAIDLTGLGHRLGLLTAASQHISRLSWNLARCVRCKAEANEVIFWVGLGGQIY